ncbi:MAG: hypothetical protein K5829_02515 [Treponema sp.]|nr:hypothetical protein [Treponema sp.]
MKFQHDFKLLSDNKGRHQGSTFSFKEADNNIQIDFFKHIMRVAMYKDGTKLLPTFSICPGDSKMPQNGRNRLSSQDFESEKVECDIKNQEIITFKTNDAKITIELHNFRMKVEDPEGKLLYQDRDYIAYNWDFELGPGSMHFISREADEKIFGLGDKSGDINKNHRHFTIATSDSMGFDARYSDPLYKQIPFYICKNSAGSYGIYYDTYSNGQMDFGVEHNNYYLPFKSARFEEEALVFYVIFGSVPEILQRFEWMCGRNMMPPLWSLKYCGSTMNYTDAPDADKQLRSFIDLCQKYGFHPGGFYLSSGYTQIGEKRYVFNWNRDKIPSPEALAAYFKENGVEFLPNVKPAFLTDHFLYDEIAKKGWFLHYKDGSPAKFPFWSGYGSYLDFTNPGAYKFWTDCVKKELVDRGYKNIWNDNNEYDICDQEVLAYNWGNPIPAKRIRPLFSYLMTQASLDAQIAGLEESKSKEVPFAVSRSGIAGLQRIAMTWTGDNNTSFEDFRYNHKMAMTMSLSGIYNFGQDIGGFAGPRPSEELFIRWIQYGIFTPRFVLHSWNPDGSSNMPWLYKERIPTVKRLFDLREKLIPYLYEQFKISHENYTPVIYPVFLKYPDYDIESDVFFFGNDILVCPVFDQGAVSVKVDLPENQGDWILGNDYFEAKEKGEAPSTCKLYKGQVELPCTIDNLPIFFFKGNFRGF